MINRTSVAVADSAIHVPNLKKKCITKCKRARDRDVESHGSVPLSDTADWLGLPCQLVCITMRIDRLISFP